MKSLRRLFRWVPSGTTCLLIVFGIFGYLGFKMGMANMLNTLMNTAHDLLLNTVFYIMAICVITGAIGRIFVEFGVVKLLEKILIFDNDLNDKVVEVIKLMILSQDVDKSEQRNCRFGKVCDDGLEFMIHDTIENQVYTSTVPKSSYETVYKSLIESGMKPYSFDWEIVDGTYATRLLNGFNNNF